MVSANIFHRSRGDLAAAATTVVLLLMATTVAIARTTAKYESLMVISCFDAGAAGVEHPACLASDAMIDERSPQGAESIDPRAVDVHQVVRRAPIAAEQKRDD